MKSKRIKYWVLKDGNNYFRDTTAIGPRCTGSVNKAMRFKTKIEAVRDPAYFFVMMSFEPEAIR